MWARAAAVAPPARRLWVPNPSGETPTQEMVWYTNSLARGRTWLRAGSLVSDDRWSLAGELDPLGHASRQPGTAQDPGQEGGCRLLESEQSPVDRNLEAGSSSVSGTGWWRATRWMKNPDYAGRSCRPISWSRRSPSQTWPLSGRLRHVQLSWTGDFGFWHFRSS